MESVGAGGSPHLLGTCRVENARSALFRSALRRRSGLASVKALTGLAVRYGRQRHYAGCHSLASMAMGSASIQRPSQRSAWRLVPSWTKPTCS